MIDFNRHIEIDNYLKGALTPEEMAAFESKLETDKHLQEEVELQKSIDLLVKNSAQFNLKSQLKNIHKEEQKKKAKKKSQKKKGLYVAAAVIIATAIVATALYFDKKETANANDDHLTNEEAVEITQSQTEEAEKMVSYVDQSNELSVHDAIPIDVLTDVHNDKNEGATTRGQQPVTGEPALKTRATGDVNDNDDGISDDDRVNDAEDISATSPDDTEVDDENHTTDPCTHVNETQPTFNLIEPCFGGASGKIKMESSNDIYFTQYSINNGVDFVSVLDETNIDVGRYQVVAKDANDCLSAAALVQVKYVGCNHVVQPLLFRNMELDLPQISSTFTFEVRNARNGSLVYTQLAEQANAFVYKGINQSGEDLLLGNYVYMFLDEDNKLIAKGQVTVIK